MEGNIARSEMKDVSTFENSRESISPSKPFSS